MARVFNFNPGPAALPLAVLERAQREFVEYGDTGMSILEHSHRGKAFDEVHNQAIGLVKELLNISNDYEVLFLQGGASLQFAMVPINLRPEGKSADYVLTGVWSKKAFEEAKRMGEARVAATAEVNGVYNAIPKSPDISKDAAYVHITTNNTIYGTQYFEFPDTGEVPLVADMSSDFMWRPTDVSRFGLIYAGAQKNIGPSGLAVVIVKKSLLDLDVGRVKPNILSYAIHASKNSLYNTPNTFGIYMVRNSLDYVKETGGLPAMEKLNRAKAATLYEVIDGAPDFFSTPIKDKGDRSVMNVVFNLPNPELEQKFIAQAAEKGMLGLKGHRSVGGMRASIYNACTKEAVDALAQFMTDFRKRV